MRKADWSHIESIITPSKNNEEDQNYSGLKYFWGFIRSQCKDHTGVASLKTIVSPSPIPKKKQKY